MGLKKSAKHYSSVFKVPTQTQNAAAAMKIAPAQMSPSNISFA